MEFTRIRRALLRRADGSPAGLEGLAVEFDQLLALAPEALEDAVEQHLGRKRQVVGDGAEHHGVAEADVAEFQGDGHGVEGTTW